MDTAHAVASASLISGWLAGGIVARVVLEAARAVVRRTRTQRDDELLARVEAWIAANPGAVDLLQQLVERSRGR